MRAAQWRHAGQRYVGTLTGRLAYTVQAREIDLALGVELKPQHGEVNPLG
jgi:hypothetical protein